MAIHDVDKNSSDRVSPQPNSHDIQGVPRMAHGTNSVNYVTDASPVFTGGNILSGNARLVYSGVVTVPTNDGIDGTITINTTSVPHNLGYRPLIMAFMNNSNAGYSIQLPMLVSVAANTGASGGAPGYLAPTRWMFPAADATNAYIVVYTSGASNIATNYTITYYLYQQTAN